MNNATDELLREVLRVHSAAVQGFMTFREQAASTFVAMSSVAIPVLLTVSDPFLRTVGTLFLDALAIIVWAAGMKSLERLIFHQRMSHSLLQRLAPEALVVIDQTEAAIVAGMRDGPDRGTPRGSLSGVPRVMHGVPFRRIWDAYLLVFLVVSTAIIAWSWLPAAYRSAILPRA